MSHPRLLFLSYQTLQESKDLSALRQPLLTLSYVDFLLLLLTIYSMLFDAAVTIALVSVCSSVTLVIHTYMVQDIEIRFTPYDIAI